MYFLQRFRCYLEAADFEVLTDNQVLRVFFSKPALSPRKARWLEFLGQFSITLLTFVKEKVNVLGDALSRAPQMTSLPAVHVSNTTAESFSFQLAPHFTSRCAVDVSFEPIHAALCDSFSSNLVQRERLS